MYVFDREKIAMIQESLGMSTYRFAKNIGCSQIVVKGWIDGLYKPGIDSLLAMCNKFGVSPTYFFREEK